MRSTGELIEDYQCRSNIAVIRDNLTLISLFFGFSRLQQHDDL